MILPLNCFDLIAEGSDLKVDGQAITKNTEVLVSYIMPLDTRRGKSEHYNLFILGCL